MPPHRDNPTLEEIASLYVESLQVDAEVRSVGPRRKSPRIGDLWLTRGSRYQDLPVLVAITHAEPDAVRAVLAFEEPELAGSDDVLVSAEQSPTSAPLVLCSWRDVPIAIQDLESLLGVLPDSVIEPLAMLLQARLLGGFVRKPVDVARLSTGEPALRWAIETEGGDTGCEYLTGSQILREADPRLRVRQELLRHSQYLERDVMEDLAGADTLGHARIGGAEALPSSSRFPLLARSGRLAELAAWRTRVAEMPHVFPLAA